MKTYTVRYTYKSTYDDLIGDEKFCETEEEAREFIEHIKASRELVYLAIYSYEQLI